MDFKMARCETCQQYIFKLDSVGLAWTVKQGKSEIIDLQGKEPWTGVRVMCKPCLKFFSEQARDNKAFLDWESSQRQEKP